MIEHRKVLARNGLTEALRLRQHNNLALNESICPYDLAEKLGINVYFDDGMPSMEAAYVNDEPPKIIVTSLRPTGRMAYSCAHEIGHHVFGHGTHVDDVMEKPQKTNENHEEFIAEVFAGFLLMPKLAVNYGFSRRKWSCHNCTPEQAFVIAGWLGVGYTTLVNHMCHSLKLITLAKAKELCKVPTKRIKLDMIGRKLRENVFWIDTYWVGRPIDAHVGDMIVVEESMKIEGDVAKHASIDNVRQAFIAIRPGIGRLYADDGSWAAFVRISRREYRGWSRYRHLEDPEHE